jgi:hypothetical protein
VVLLRLVALMLAIVMIGAAPQLVHAGADVVGEVSEVSEVDELGDSTTAEAVCALGPEPGRGAGAVSRSHARGRSHTTLVFRPPR